MLPACSIFKAGEPKINTFFFVTGNFQRGVIRRNSTGTQSNAAKTMIRPPGSIAGGAAACDLFEIDFAGAHCVAIQVLRGQDVREIEHGIRG